MTLGPSHFDSDNQTAVYSFCCQSSVPSGYNAARLGAADFILMRHIE